MALAMSYRVKRTAANIAFVAIFLATLMYVGLVAAVAIYIVLNLLAMHDAKRRRAAAGL